jgi:hypothetical protein
MTDADSFCVRAQGHVNTGQTRIAFRKIHSQVRDLAALEAYRNVGTILKGDSLSMSSNGREVSIDDGFNRNIDKIIGPDEVIEGSLTGRS